MAFEQKPNSGSIFENDRKTEDGHADMTGSALIDGKEFWVNAWRRTSKDGGKEYVGLSFKAKD